MEGEGEPIIVYRAAEGLSQQRLNQSGRETGDSSAEGPQQAPHVHMARMERQSYGRERDNTLETPELLFKFPSYKTAGQTRSLKCWQRRAHCQASGGKSSRT